MVSEVDRPEVYVLIAQDTEFWAMEIEDLFRDVLDSWAFAQTRQFDLKFDTCSSSLKFEQKVEQHLAEGRTVYATLEVLMPTGNKWADSNDLAYSLTAGQDLVACCRSNKRQYPQTFDFCFITGVPEELPGNSDTNCVAKENLLADEDAISHVLPHCKRLILNNIRSVSFEDPLLRDELQFMHFSRGDLNGLVHRADEIQKSAATVVGDHSFLASAQREAAARW